MQWCDEYNFGVTHFGVHPKKLPLSIIRSDVFHCRKTVTCSLLEFLRKWLFKQEISKQDEFGTEVLSKFWPQFFVTKYLGNYKLSSLRGATVSDFIKNISLVVKWLEPRILPNGRMKSFCNGLELWYSITEFMSLVEIVHYDKSIEEQELERIDYVEEMILFSTNVKLFYECGKLSFLSEKEVGDKETSYMHTVRYYLPRFAKITWERHELGLGIFTMQGFERRNKESKNTLKRFTNFRSNTLVNNVKLLYDYFYFGKK